MKPTKIILWVVVAILAVVIGYMLFMPKNGAQQGFANVDSNGVRQAQKRGATVLDVRSESEYNAGHIPGAQLVADGTYAQALANADRNKEYVVYCATGSRSTVVVDWMKANGFKNVKHFNQGIVSWDGDLAGGSEAGQAEGASSALHSSLVAPKNGVPVVVEFATNT